MNKRFFPLWICLLLILILATAINAQPQLSYSLMNQHFPLAYDGKLYRHQKHFSTVDSTAFVFRPTTKRRIEIDYENNRVTVSEALGNAQWREPWSMPYDTYRKSLTQFYFQRYYQNYFVERSQKTQKQKVAGLIPDVEIPYVRLPKSLQKIIGKKTGNIRIQGSQTTTLGAKRVKREGFAGTLGDESTSLSPKIESKLNLQLNGTIGEKIHVDVTHQSGGDGMLSDNRVNVRYEGTEDEVIQTIEGGETNFRLPSTSLISVPSQNSMFGLKTDLKFGPVDMTVIFSKQTGSNESKSFKNQAREQTKNVDSKDFVKYKYFFIENPLLVYDITDGRLASENGELIITNGGLLPKEGTLRVYYDNITENEDDDIVNCEVIGDTSSTYRFTLLEEGIDYSYNYDTGILEFRTSKIQVDKCHIGITYVAQNDAIVGTPDWIATDTTPLQLKLLRHRDDEPGSERWDQMLQNVYYLGANSIDPESFELKITHREENDWVEAPNGAAANCVTLLEIDNDNNGLVTEADNTSGNFRPINFAAGTVWFPYLHPFLHINPPDSVYHDKTPDEYEYRLETKYNARSDQINLGVINVVENSEKVTANGKTLTKGVDYTIFYETGTVIITNPDYRNADLDITYEYKPLFMPKQKNFVGFHAKYSFLEHSSISTVWFYESSESDDKHPKIGAESYRMIAGGLDAKIEIRPQFLTHFVNFWPTIDTEAHSSIALDLKTGISMPFPNTDSNQEAYLDDMEGVTLTVPLGITTYSSWSMASTPYTQLDENRGYCHWFNPYESVDKTKKREVYSNITDPDEKNDDVVTFEIELSGDISNAEDPDTISWAGVMRYLGELDLSEKKYIEFYAHVSHEDTLMMHLDLGKYISEDFYWFDGGKNVLNEENDDQGLLDYGLDGITTGTAGDDPHDDYNKVRKGKPLCIYPWLNGTENNDKLDTEDLNGNGYLDMEQGYYDIALNLNAESSPYLIDENQATGWRLFRIPLADTVIIKSQGSKSDGNSWEDIYYSRIWFEYDQYTHVKFASMEVVGNRWEERTIADVEDVNAADSLAVLSISTFDTRSNARYVAPPNLLSSQEQEDNVKEQSVVLTVENLAEDRQAYAVQKYAKSMDFSNYKNIRFYVYGEAVGEEEREETVFVRFGVAESSKKVPHYYEYRKPIRFAKINSLGTSESMREENWYELEISMSDLMDAKEDTVLFIQEGEDSENGARIWAKGSPSLLAVSTLTVGLLREEDDLEEPFTGRVFFDDIRVGEPYDDIGFSNSVSLSVALADLMNVSVSYKKTDDNFYTSKSSGRPKSESSAYSLSASMDVNKLLPKAVGIKLPVNYNYSKTTSLPRYKPSSDIILDTAEREEYKTETTKRSVQTSLEREKTQKSDFFLTAMTIDCMRFSFKYDNTQKYLPDKTTYKREDQRDYRSSFNYNFRPQKSETALNIANTANHGWNLDFYYFPNAVTFSVDSDVNDRKEARYEINDTTGVGSWNRTHPINKDKLVLKFSTDYELFTNFTYGYDLNSTRDRALQEKYEEHKKLGLETNRTEKNSLEYKFNYFSDYFTPSAKVDATYSQKQLFNDNSTQQDTSSTDEEAYTSDYDYNMERTFQADLSLKPGKLFTSICDLPFRLGGGLADTSQSDSVATKEPFTTAGFWEMFTKMSGKYSLSQKTTYDNVEVLPDWNYRFGLNLEADTLTWQSKTDKYSYTGNMGLKPLSQVTLDGAYGYAYTESWTKSTVKKTEKTVFPDVSMKLSSLRSIFPDSLNMFEFMETMEVTSSYKHEETLAGNEDLNNPNTITNMDSFSPLARLTWKMFRDVACNASFSMSNSETENTGASGGTANKKFDKTKTLNGGMKYSFSAPRGMKIPFSKKRIRFESKLTTSLDFEYKFQEQYTQRNDSEELNLRKTTFSIKPKADYTFSSNVTGGLDAEYSTETDDKMNRSTNTIQFNLHVTLKF